MPAGPKQRNSKLNKDLHSVYVGLKSGILLQCKDVLRIYQNEVSRREGYLGLEGLKGRTIVGLNKEKLSVYVSCLVLSGHCEVREHVM
jgi:hypothetical protein